ncbi:MAG: hypothetical protein OEW68_01060 [Gammaproteobacteria bacterium]|nr:hypothetical protein [Gammaproteobacteria bacterium]MDH4313412.1 hypothetical protein [Gammaproteobacteria bacterium]MDH5214067.1 hypothetical protein [Gammaproteobacteria bacterium]
MKKHNIVATMAAMLALLVSGSVLAQVSKDGLGKVLPVELFACKYHDGKSAADLEKVITRWTKYMDDNGINDYAAWTLTPYHYGPNQDFDVIWMGAFADFNAMGSGINTWLTKGGELQKAYFDVLDCNGHALMSSAMYKAPANNETPASGIITMMDCKLNDGKRYSDIKDAEMKWAKYLGDGGSKAGYWHWFPTFGGGDADFDYKVVFAYENYVDLGADMERNANGGGRESSQEIFADIDDCDDARVYLATSRRAAKLR